MIQLVAKNRKKARLGALLGHFAVSDDLHDLQRIAHQLTEALIFVVSGTVADCDDYDHIAAWGEALLGFPRRHLVYGRGLLSGRWLTILMNRIKAVLFFPAVTAWMREAWPD